MLIVDFLKRTTVLVLVIVPVLVLVLVTGALLKQERNVSRAFQGAGGVPRPKCSERYRSTSCFVTSHTLPVLTARSLPRCVWTRNVTVAKPREVAACAKVITSCSALAGALSVFLLI